MTKKLEELLNVAPADEDPTDKLPVEVDPAESKDQIVELEKNLQDVDNIEKALSTVELNDKTNDIELDDIATKADETFDNLMDLGMNVESRYSARIFEVAGQMLKTNLEAKTAKLDKKLKMVELQLKKQKQDQKSGDADSNVISGEGYVVSDRNSLIEKLKKLDKYNKDGNNDKDDK